MNVCDTANKLALELRESKEYREYKLAKQKIMENNNFKSKIEEFEKGRYDVQVLALRGNQEDNEKIARLQELYSELVQIPEIKNYFDLEVKFNILVADVNKIIGEAIKDIL